MENLFDQPLTDEAKRAIIAVGFAALLKAYGKPIEIPDTWADALPDHFDVVFEDTDTGRTFSYQEIQK